MRGIAVAIARTSTGHENIVVVVAAVFAVDGNGFHDFHGSLDSEAGHFGYYGSLAFKMRFSLEIVTDDLVGFGVTV